MRLAASGAESDDWRYVSRVHLRVGREQGAWRIRSERDGFFTRVAEVEVPKAQVRRKPDKTKELLAFGEKTVPRLNGKWEFCGWKPGEPPFVPVQVACTLQSREIGDPEKPSLVIEGGPELAPGSRWVFVGGPFRAGELFGGSDGPLLEWGSSGLAVRGSGASAPQFLVAAGPLVSGNYEFGVKPL